MKQEFQTYRDYVIEIIIDEYPENPRDNDNLAKLVCSHDKYKLGDKQVVDADDYFEEFSGLYMNDFEDLKDFYVKAKELIESKYVVLPLYLYDHSGITMSTKPFSCMWDSGQVGFALIEIEKFRKDFQVEHINREEVEKYIRQEVETYDTYLRGNVLAYKITNSEGEEEIGGGYYEKQDAINDAKIIIDSKYKTED